MHGLFSRYLVTFQSIIISRNSAVTAHGNANINYTNEPREPFLDLSSVEFNAFGKKHW
jgi:hypothetical protein